MQFAAYLKEKRGRLSRLAEAVSGAVGRRVQPGYLSQVAAGAKPVRPRYVPAIERATGYEVRCWDLCPDEWHLIWPELIGTPGAPPVPTTAPEEACDAA
ncbi:UNVERIFIED_ORG: helix-turn-helix domain-containing protein [Shinella sp. XGS7]|nr:YdaS family helix-turn-helix protein [Shinella sp. XGS7]